MESVNILLKHWFVVAMAALALLAPVNSGRAADPILESSNEGPEIISPGSDEETTDEPDLYQPSVSVPLSVGVPIFTPAIEFHGGVMFLQPSSDNLGWAVLTTEENYSSPVPIASPYWNIQTIRPEMQPGFEFGAGYAFDSAGKDFQANWQHLRTCTTQSAATNNTGQWISPFTQTGPPTAASYDEIYFDTGVDLLQSAQAHVKFAYDAVNVDFGQYVSFGPALSMRMFAGLSFARVQERLLTSFYGVPPASNAVFPDSVPLVISLNNTSTFSGVGPRFGLDSTLETRRGFRFTGQVAGALLIGRTDPAQYLFSATAPDLAAVGIAVNQEFIGSQSFTHVVPSGNAKLGEIGRAHV